MSDIQLLVISILFFASIATKMLIMKTRGYNPTRSATLEILSSVASLLIFSIFILAFILFRWWEPIAYYLAFAIIASFFVNQRSFSFFYIIEPIINIILIVLAIVAWNMYL